MLRRGDPVKDSQSSGVVTSLRLSPSATAGQTAGQNFTTPGVSQAARDGDRSASSAVDDLFAAAFALAAMGGPLGVLAGVRGFGTGFAQGSPAAQKTHGLPQCSVIGR